MSVKLAIVSLIILLLQSSAFPQTRNENVTTSFDWELQNSDVRVSLRGICAVDEMTCWASGAGGVVILTVDGGQSWNPVGPPNSVEIDFRDVYAWDARRALIMAAGDPDQILRTDDGGQRWEVVHDHPDRTAFFDGMAFDAEGRTGWIMSDPIGQKLVLLRTSDSGKTWRQEPDSRMPLLPTGIAGFAASGTNLCIAGKNRIIVGLGGAVEETLAKAPTFCVSHDNGSTWKLVLSPIQSGKSAGVFSVCATDQAGQHLVAVGGDYQLPDQTAGNVAISSDGGMTWQQIAGNAPNGFRSAVAVAGYKGNKWRSVPSKLLITVGPNGTDFSLDGGQHWQCGSTMGFHAVSFASGTAVGWACGADGSIARSRQTELHSD